MKRARYISMVLGMLLLVTFLVNCHLVEAARDKSSVLLVFNDQSGRGNEDDDSNKILSENGDQTIAADTFYTVVDGICYLLEKDVDDKVYKFVDNLGIERLLILPEGKISYYDRDIVEHYQTLNKRIRR